VSSRGGFQFIDEVRISASSGRGGDGLVAFRREKFVPKGGPAGGDGGRGGQVWFVATRQRNTLHHLRFTPQLKAKNGVPGGSANKTGKRGADLIIEVPVGTLIKNGRGVLLQDLDEGGQRYLALEGGAGGQGNARFTTATRQAPDFASAGGPAKEGTFQLELKLLADVGLLGYPNAGKSTLISRLSAAKPKVAAYPFTTLTPSLGVVAVPGTHDAFVMADIPGLIEGASDGAGLGLRFLRHVERCSLLLHLISLDPLEIEVNGAALERFERINGELKRFNPQLARRPQVVLLSKADLVQPEELAAVLLAFEQNGQAVLVGSAVTGAGMDPLVYALQERLLQSAEESA